MSLSIPHQLSPIPGNPSGIRRIATKFTNTATAIDDAISELRSSIIDARACDSEAVDAVSGVSEEVVERLSSLKSRYSTAGAQLASFASSLETAQADTSGLLREQEQWQNTLSWRNTQVSQHAQNAPRFGEAGYFDELREYRQREYQLSVGVNEAHQALGSLQRRYETVVSTLRQRGSAAASALNGAIRADGLNDSMWDRVSNWVSENAGWLKVLHSILQTITAALAILSFFIPVLAPFALLAAGLTAGLSLLLAASGEISWVDFGLDLLTVATFGVAAAATAAVRVTTQALRVTRVNTIMSRGVSQRAALSRVSQSFNGVVNQTTRTTVGGLTRPTFQWGREIFTNKGVTNAHFLRFAQNGRSGASLADDALIASGQGLVAISRTAHLMRTVPTQFDALFETYLQIPETLYNQGAELITGENPNADFMAPTYEWYQNWKNDHATWKVGG